MQEAGTRLNKFLATRLGIGRREADDLIVKGKVLINGSAPILGARVKDGDRVEVSGKQVVTAKPHFMYLLMNKPKGYVCSKRKQGDTPTIFELLPSKYQGLKTVGRLDKDSSGLIMLTNDGELAHRLTHPKFAKLKTYELTLNKPLEPLHHQMINDKGIDLPDGNSKLGLQRLKDGNNTEWLVTMFEGRNRQIRRTFAALGYLVTKLHRTGFSDFTLNKLAPGEAQEVKLQ